MSPENFCYWLQGYFELGGDDIHHLDEEQTQMVKDHLDLVFEKVTGAPISMPYLSSGVTTVTNLPEGYKPPITYCSPRPLSSKGELIC